MPKKLSLFFKTIYSLLAVIVIILFYTLSQHCYFSDSEIWLLTLSQKSFNIGPLTSIYYKWIFHSFTYLFSHYSSSELDVYLWARLGWATIALATSFIISLTMGRIFNRKSIILPTMIFITTSSLFFNQGFRIRADILTLFFHSLCVFYLIYKLDNPITKKDYLIFIMLNLCLLLTTPKAVYFIFAQFSLALMLSFTQHKTKYRAWVLLVHIVPVALIALTLVISSLLPWTQDLTYVATTALDFFLRTYDQKLANPGFFSQSSFLYIFNFIRQNWIHAAVVYSSLFITLIELLAKPKLFFKHWSLISSMQLYCILVLSIALIHNHKLPFFLATCITPLCAFSFSFLIQRLRQNQPAISLLGPLLISMLVVYAAYQQFEVNRRYNSNRGQRIAIKILDRYTTNHPDLKIYDVIGILPRKNKIFAFTGPSEVAKKEATLQVIQNQDPDIILLTNKSKFLQPQLQDYLNQSMISYGPGVWVKGKELSPIKTSHIFNHTISIQDSDYWVVPKPKGTFIYSQQEQRFVQSEVISLNKSYKISKSNISHIGIPRKYLILGFSTIQPLDLPGNPNNLFRFDTGF